MKVWLATWMDRVSVVWKATRLLYLQLSVMSVLPFWFSILHPNTSNAPANAWKSTFHSTQLMRLPQLPLQLLQNTHFLSNSPHSPCSQLFFLHSPPFSEILFFQISKVVEGEEVLLVKCIIVEVIHQFMDGNVPLFRTSVHSGARAENINYRIWNIIRGFKLSDLWYLAICSDNIWSVALCLRIDLLI